MIFMILRVIVKGEMLDEGVRLLHYILGPLQFQPGCLACQACRELDNENVLILRQEWASQADLDRYIRSDEFRKILALMELASKPPELRFDTILNSMGLEYVKEILG